MDSLGLTWAHLDSFGLTWSPFDSLGATRSLPPAYFQLDSLQHTFSQMISIDLTWSHLDILGLIWSHFGLEGAAEDSPHKGKRESLLGEKGKGKDAITFFSLVLTSILHQAHARTRRNDFPVGVASSTPNLRLELLRDAEGNDFGKRNREKRISIGIGVSYSCSH